MAVDIPEILTLKEACFFFCVEEKILLLEVGCGRLNVENGVIVNLQEYINMQRVS